MLSWQSKWPGLRRPLHWVDVLDQIPRGRSAVYLCGAVLVTAAEVMFPAATAGPAFLAGLLWPVVVIGTVQTLLLELVA